MRIARRCAAVGITPVLSSTFESPYSLCFLAHVAAAADAAAGSKTAHGLGTFEWFCDDGSSVLAKGAKRLMRPHTSSGGRGRATPSAGLDLVDCRREIDSVCDHYASNQGGGM
uniref:Uncharacterized protein n=1 Tax=Lotharella oceanica TaxID=641309 RepID=A0A7S2TYR7_9EUKA|mmetsp:Transcript_34222/g.63454  ORF Transcript_34222/g.63454 Transcript_34222/m.63454 type:complete len:113 (+) Transcript_34222:1-339(+)